MKDLKTKISTAYQNVIDECNNMSGTEDIKEAFDEYTDLLNELGRNREIAIVWVVTNTSTDVVHGVFSSQEKAIEYLNEDIYILQKSNMAITNHSVL